MILCFSAPFHTYWGVAQRHSGLPSEQPCHWLSPSLKLQAFVLLRLHECMYNCVKFQVPSSFFIFIFRSLMSCPRVCQCLSPGKRNKTLFDSFKTLVASLNNNLHTVEDYFFCFVMRYSNLCPPHIILMLWNNCMYYSQLCLKFDSYWTFQLSYFANKYVYY